MAHVVTLTMNPAVDLSASTEKLVVGKKTRCGAQQRRPGGGGINVARGIRKLGGKPLAVYPAGGGTGEFLDQLIDAEGVNRRTIATAESTRENFSIHEARSDYHYHFVFSGPRLRQNEWEACLETLANLRPTPSQLVLSGSLPPGVPQDFYVRVAALFRDKSTQLILDTSSEPLRSALETGHFHVVKPNRRELEQIYDISAEHPEDYIPCMENFVESGTVDNVVVTLGAEGTLLVSRHGDRLQLRAPPVEGKSPVGAGDSFVALLAHALSERNTLPEAVAYGVAGAAAAVETSDAELYRVDDIERFYARIKTVRFGAAGANGGG